MDYKLSQVKFILVEFIILNHVELIMESEFCSPKNRALLGLNVGGGIHVKLRLRRADRDEEFLPFHEVLDTMLHELCHNVHGPHNASFYKLWDEIRKVNGFVLSFMPMLCVLFLTCTECIYLALCLKRKNELSKKLKL